MVVVGIDPHKSSHTAVAVDQTGRRLAQKTVTSDRDGLLRLRSWASQFGTGPRWAVEDGRSGPGRR
ncbi:IS110 family transposase [Amycolatopsis sp. 195334CR]|uniref:IS110 family transposase n=1 Tax=Amycolatopsis sp. 195334CR TaxID=2814588 RepID=UPI001F5D59F8|nr:IS110 family transposase [Amycolatopsis sp. 195334CR]